MALILIVDDSQTVRSDLRVTLEGAGHRVIEASDGVAGLTAIKSNPDIAVVITDLNMPSMNGLEMLKQAREKLGEFRFKVFVHTTDTSETSVADGQRIGVTAWMLKPFKPNRLLEAIERVVGK